MTSPDFDGLKLDDTIEKMIATMSAPGADFAVTRKEIEGVSYQVFEKRDSNLRDVYASCSTHGAADFLVYEGERYSFDEGIQEAWNLAAMLKQKYGVKKGDRIALIMRNYPEWCISYIAATAMGAVIVPMNGWWTTEELNFALDDCGANIVIADRERVERLKPLINKNTLHVIAVRCEGDQPDGVSHYKAIMADFKDQPEPDEEIDELDDAMILYTSGTTGHPKGAVSTHLAILSVIKAWTLITIAGVSVQAQENEKQVMAPEVNPPQPATLVSVPLFHVTGCNAVFLISLPIGRKLVLMHKWDPTRALQLIQDEKVTGFTGVPTMSWEIVTHPDVDNYDISSLASLGSGGAARPPEQVRQMTQKFPRSAPGSGYGLTETNGMGAINSGTNYLIKPGSTGKPTYPIVEMKIVNDSGEEQPQGERGEVLIRSASNIRGYWNQPEKTSEDFVNGWLHTGDVGLMDEDGFLWIVDRLKEIVIRGGENISVTEVEQIIHQHAGVMEVACYGVPDERLGEALAATIMLVPGTSLSERELREHIAAQLAAFKIPTHIAFQNEQLERGATGKIFKRGIREEAIQRLKL
jgi:steroid-24-oyl-CoA synthetase